MDGTLSVSGLGGSDTVTVTDLTVTKATTITLGSETDLLTIRNATFASTVSIDTGDGNDIVYLDRDDSNTGTSFTLPGTVTPTVTIKLGAGDDRIYIGADAADRVLFSGRTVIDGGLGVDLYYCELNSKFLGTSQVLGFER
ncbi:MAG: hypothetical protein U0792_12480 [Gemmataceae bacterium]